MHVYKYMWRQNAGVVELGNLHGSPNMYYTGRHLGCTIINVSETEQINVTAKFPTQIFQKMNQL